MLACSRIGRITRITRILVRQQTTDALEKPDSSPEQRQDIPKPASANRRANLDREKSSQSSFTEYRASQTSDLNAKCSRPNPLAEDPKTDTLIEPVGHGAVFDIEKHQENLVKIAMPFDEVPGPKILQRIAKVWSLIPVLGTQLTASTMMYMLNTIGTNMLWNQKVWPFQALFDRYGPIVRLHGPLGGDIVFLSRPEHIEAVYRQEGRYPVRSSLDSIEEYRLQHRKMRSAGPYIMSGPEWEDLRHKIEAPLQKSVMQYHDTMGIVAQEFVARIQTIRNRQEEVGKDFQTEIYKWGLESVGLVAFNKRLGCLNVTSSTLSVNSEAGRLLEAVMEATSALGKCESGFQWWRFFETSAWVKLVTTCDTIDSIASKHIRLAQNRLRTKTHVTASKSEPVDENEEQPTSEDFTPASAPLLEALLLNENLLPEDILTVVLDMMLIGVNATCHAMGFLLFHLAKSPRIQRELYDELITVMPYKSSHIAYNHFQKLPLLQACIKESLRLNPPIPTMTRVIPKDIALHSYRIPKGTYMLMTNHVACLKEENFEDAKRFKPDRWLKGDRDIHPFAALPFGHGPRSCVGRGLAELQLWMLTAKIIRNFRIEYHYGDIKATRQLISFPNKPLRFRFIDRPDN